ncbi:MAG TPA: SbcC/MukB-like Walker B domain-containing protein [Chthoniobacteraceae bacterium]|jgi:energy-coupling factor transporter ATP-binding protein EcfA2|nr:SbcC/MukB-like Walker B domain-containing protein [Chthoniobacteraceae bacterium]
MSRAIRLTRMHALNWYGYRDSIKIEGNLLLAGVTGSGKSILMDLLQYVLVGDLRLVRFNQSATGDRSDRSLKGYCLGDTKQEEAGVTQYMRDRAISYVALEFTWPRGKKVETWGFRIEFASAAETQGRVSPFFVPAALERGDFLDAERVPLEHGAFKAMVESHAADDGVKGRVYAELGEYLAHMAQPAHLNFDRSVLRSLLPTAMSFTFLRSFNDFCRHFILSADRLDVRDVTDSYRAFLRYESDLRLLNDQFVRLRAICGLSAEHGNAARESILARYLEAELRHQHARELLRIDEERFAALRAACAEEEGRLTDLLERLIPAQELELERLKNAIRETPDGPLYLEIKARNQQLAHEIERLRQTGRTVDSALQARVRGARAWLYELEKLPLKLERRNLEAVERAVAALEAGGVAGFGPAFRALSATAQTVAAELSRQAQGPLAQLAKIRRELGELNEAIRALDLGRLPMSTRLLDALNHALLAAGPELPARHLRELCEVRESEERWRPAIEVAFTRKFAVVVAPEHYDTAEAIYHELREESRGESLVNPAKALKMQIAIQPGSLAEKLVATHPVAQAIVSRLFGELRCVERREELREHDAAITPDGFMSRGAFVERPRHYDNLPFVGQRGLQQQLAWKQKQRDELATEERRLKPLEEDLQAAQSKWREVFDPPPSLWEDLARASELPKREEELRANIDRLKLIDRAKLDDLAQRQQELELALHKLRDEQRALDRSERRLEFRRLEKDLELRRTAEQEAKERFARAQETDVSPWLPQLAALRAEMLARYPQPDAAAEKCADLFHQRDKEAVEKWQQLIAARRELAMTHPRFDDLSVEAPDNAAYDKQFAKLDESEIPDYTGKAERERKTWATLFRTQVLEKLRNALFEVENTRVLLNGYLKRPIGNNRYRIIKWSNPDFALYHRLLDASALAHADELFFAAGEADLREAVKQFLHLLVDQPDSVEAGRLLDYRHYYEYDMEVEDLGEDGEVKATSRVDRQSGKFSGGENQSPYFIAILASYLRAYKRHDTRTKQPSLALVPIDEAFSKLSGERIKDCIEALAALDLQGVFSMSTGNIPYAFEHCDSLVVVAKEETRSGKRVRIRNVPVSLHKDSPEARRLLNLED